MNPIFIHTADDARAIDYNTIHDIGIPSLVLMEHAAARCTDIILENSAQDDKIWSYRRGKYSTERTEDYGFLYGYGL